MHKVLIITLAFIFIINSTVTGHAQENNNWGLEKINIEQAWKTTKGNKDVVVAIIDSGIDLENLEFRNRIVKPYNIIQNNNDVQDKNGHGTHIAGIIGAQDDGVGSVGIAPDVSIMPIKIFDQSSDIKNLVKAIEYACDQGADIVNCSVVIDPPIKNRYTFDFKSWSIVDNYYNEYMENDIKTIIKENSDVLFLFPSGNKSKSNAFFPARYELDNIISVAAIDEDNKLWREGIFSNKGSNYNKNSVDIGAPGVNILSTGLNGLEYKTGTSMATAYVTGVCALVKSKYPDFTPVQIKKVIVDSAKYSKYLKNKVLSNGILDADKSLDIANNQKKTD